MENGLLQEELALQQVGLDNLKYVYGTNVASALNPPVADLSMNSAQLPV
jgi:hypothetical protein